jgi:hypothetical protein
VQGVRQVLVARDARGVERQQVIPAAVLVLDLPQQRLEARALVILAGFNRVLEGLDDREVAGLGQFDQLAALCVQADVVAVLARPQVYRCAVQGVPTMR